MSSEVLLWIRKSVRRVQVLAAFHQPLTARQLSLKTTLDLDACSHTLQQLAVVWLVSCLNPSALRSRLYWLTREGETCQHDLPDAPRERWFPSVDYDLYGWICYSQRSAVVLALDRPLQPAEVKRRARLRDARLRMSANNVRDIIRLLLTRGLVRRVWLRKRVHPRYELTETGRVLRELLLRAGQRS